MAGTPKIFHFRVEIHSPSRVPEADSPRPIGGKAKAFSKCDALAYMFHKHVNSGEGMCSWSPIA